MQAGKPWILYRFEQLPACLYEMSQLEILCAADNQIKLLYVEGLSKLERLATLDLHNNNIDFIPPLLGNMTQLRYVHNVVHFVHLFHLCLGIMNFCFILCIL